ncbi:N-acetylneuraminate lyase-like isoform X1 [Schistocerca americana]|uniref:N-acetylneuraminate lyase-like isoform X1 n=1 Tax=Schistocerca americana TaxID=7009 RepID=UPI001F4F7A2F|nr:N-acetylneuraminate lyase-like isoform X1 [Schistocerca americana]XP_047114733.1 N-acetylneuraminate lyase-like isoform X1 [Schistocerca piceifrons]
MFLHKFAACRSIAKYHFQGLMSPVLTPFKRDSAQSVNLDIIPKYAKYLSDVGINAVLVNGTSGEGMSMTVDERKAVTKAWVDAAKTTKQVVMVQVGGACMKDVLHMAKHCEDLGVSGLLCLPELFNRPASIQDLVRYLKEVGKAAPKTPLLYYHLPAYTGVNFSVPNFLEAALKEIPTFAGAKYTNTNIEEAIQCLLVNNGDVSVFLGCDQVLAGAATLGYNSTIATTLNMLPGPAQKIFESIKKGDAHEAHKQQMILNQAIKAMTRYGVWVPAMKAAMNLMTPIDVGEPRPPLVGYSEQEKKQLKEELKSLKLIS